MTLPTFVGSHSAANGASTTNTYLNDFGTIAVQDGDYLIWVTMIQVNNATLSTPPAGWTQRYNFNVVGSRTVLIYDKVWHTGDPTTVSYKKAVANSDGNMVVIFRGANSTNNIYGTGQLRANNSPANQGITVAPSITTTASDTKAILISCEATSAAETAPYDTGPSMPSGWTQLAYRPQDASAIETITVAYKDMATAGATGNATVTYQQVATNNAVALQIGVAPGTPPPPPQPTSRFAFISDFTTNSLRIAGKIVNGTSAKLSLTPTAGGATIVSSAATPSSQGWLTAKLTGLTAGTSYNWKLLASSADYADVQVASGSAKTLGTDVVSFTAITSSCQTTGANPIVLDQIKAEAPDFFAHQGDLHYADATDEATWRAAMDSSLSASKMVNMFATVPMTYHWDNHDWGGNSSYKDSPVSTFAPAAVRELLGTDMPDTKGLYATWAQHGIRFVETDQWALRDQAVVVPDDSSRVGKSMLGATQLAWLFDTFLKAQEPIIIWLCSFPLYSNMIGNGRWGNFLDEASIIDNWLKAHPGIKRRIVCIGGDSHSICADDGTNTMWTLPSLNASPLQQTGGLASGTWNIINLDVDDTKGYYSKMTFTPSSGKVNFLWEAKQDDGTLMASWAKDFPNKTTVSVWDGTQEVPAYVEGVWDGTKIIPASFEVTT